MSANLFFSIIPLLCATALIPFIGIGSLLSTVSIIGDQVRATRTSTGDESAGCKCRDTGNNSSRGRQALKGNQVGSKAGDVWSGHRSTRNGIGRGGAADP